jgi:rhamnosyltransferase
MAVASAFILALRQLQKGLCVQGTRMTDIALRIRPAGASTAVEGSTTFDAKPEAPSAESICAVIVTYHPDMNICDHVGRIVSQVSQTVIVDNGSPEACVEQLKAIAARFAVHLILNPRNEGIARALNQGAEWACSVGFAWILMLDQDTAVAPHMVESLTEVFRCHPHARSLAVIGSTYTDKVTGKLKTTPSNAQGPKYAEAVSTLTSGSLISLRVYRVIGGFRREFFIDCVDHEYCLRARSRGYQVVVTSKPVMTHGIGHLTEHRVLWKTVGTANYVPARQYFLSRNSFVMAREYLRTDPRWVLAYLWSWLKSIVVICLFEKARGAKIKSIFRGCMDGVLGRMSF